MDKLQVVRECLENARAAVEDMIVDLPRSTRRVAVDLDSSLDSAEHWLNRLSDAVVASKLDD